MPCNKIISFDEFENNVAKIDLTNDGIKYALQYLKTKQQACEIVFDFSDNPQRVYKFSSIDGTKCVISETDQNIYRNKLQEIILTKSVEDLEHKINEYENIARKFVRENKKLLAKSYLKKKSILQKQLSKCDFCFVFIQINNLKHFFFYRK